MGKEKTPLKMAEEQTALSTKRTKMATKRTSLAYQRTNMANTQTLLAYIRTAIGILAAGVGMVAFVGQPNIILLGKVLIGVAPALAVVGIINFFITRKKINGEEQ